MKIENVKALGEYFKDVPIGEVFKSSSQLYIKLPKVYDTAVDDAPIHTFGNHTYNAINIITNDLSFFGEEEMIYPMQAVLKIY